MKEPGIIFWMTSCLLPSLPCSVEVIHDYNIPELITGEVAFSEIEIRDKILEVATPATLEASVDTLYMKEHLHKRN